MGKTVDLGEGGNAMYTNATDKRGLTARDLVTIGIFSALFLVLKRKKYGY